MKLLSQPAPDDIQLPMVFWALSDPLRLEIVRQLMRETEQTCKDFEWLTTKSNISHHMRILRETGVTSTRIEGTSRYIRLRLDELEPKFPGLFALIMQTASDPSEHDAERPSDGRQD